MEHSTNLDALAAALTEAQKEIEGAAKDKFNPGYKSKYADLSSVMDACKPALSKNGFAIIQGAEPSDTGTLCLTTMLLHKSGQWISGTMTLPLAKQDPQGYGSALTYARRYGLAAIAGVCPEDDDAQSAVRSSQTYEEYPQATRFDKEAEARPSMAVAGQSINNSGAQCKACHAPNMKPHAAGCPDR